MRAGDIIANRFVIEQSIGSGGMGSVYRAADRNGGVPVAVKVLDLVSEGALERFQREARVLAELSHPGVVHYIAHGETPSGEPFLAMELLDGVDLAQRLARGRLSIDESLVLLRRTAEVLAFAHDKGVVHRDIKPSNVFLVGGDVERVKVLDFGIARASSHTHGLTQTGAMLGTVGYMAPEQAMGSRDVDARADVFALGCVLFECLTARPAFSGEHAVAILAKVLAEEAPKVSEVEPSLGDGLDSLVARMLAKKREDRPADATAVLQMLNDPRVPAPRSSPIASAARLSHAEQKVVSVILAEHHGDAATTETMTPEEASSEVASAGDIGRRFGAEFTPLQGGAWLFVLSGKGAASDQAAQAAACALAVQRRLPSLRMALATGRAETAGRLPVGAAIDRAAALLRHEPGSQGVSGRRIAVDIVSAGLLESRFEVDASSGAAHWLVGERGAEQPRLLLGRPTPCVGREKDLAILEATLRECISEPVARAVMIFGPAGIGKSRLRQEFAARAQPHAKVLIGRADPVAGRAALAVVRQLLAAEFGLGAAGVQDSRARHGHLRGALSALFSGDDLVRVSEFLGEIAGAPPPDDTVSPLFLAARNDPSIMAEHTHRAFEDWCVAETGRGPLVMLLEDLHWADDASVAYIESAFRRCAEQPLLIVAFCRPEFRDQRERAVADAQEIILAPLTRRASEALVRAVLGGGIESDTVARVVEQAGGNAFYLEELIRSAAEGETQSPETVLAMVESRIGRLDPELRRVLRAASVFGDRFWDGAVAALVGDGAADQVPAMLRTLTDGEFIERVATSRFAGAKEYAIRHGLVRDAAYAMLTDADRIAGHRCAGEWLEARGETDAVTIADHFERGQAPDKALPWFVTAVRAEAALEHRGEVLRRLVARGVACGASGQALGILRAAEATSYWMRGFGSDLDPAVVAGVEALRLLTPGSAEWWRVAGLLSYLASMLARHELFMSILSRVLELATVSPPKGPYALAIRWLIFILIFSGQREMSLALLERLEGSARAGEVPDLVFTAEIETSRAFAHAYLFDDLPAHCRAFRASMSAAATAGRRRLLDMAFLYAPAQIVVGDYSGARETLATVSELLKNFPVMLEWIAFWEAWLEALTGRPEVVKERLSPVLDSGDLLLGAFARLTISGAARLVGDLNSAEADARLLLDLPWSVIRFGAIVILAACELDRARPAEALAWLDTGAELDGKGTDPTDRSTAMLLRARALDALGEHDRARDAIRVAADRIRKHAAGMPTPELSQCYLAIADHVRTLELEREWVGGASGG